MKKRVLYFLWILGTIIIGLLSGTSIALSFLPDLGDILYGLMFYGIVAFVFPTYKPLKIAILSICCCYLIECSQLCQADWLNTIRSNRLGRLVLGYGFLWMDLLFYTVGGLFGGLLKIITN